MINKSAAGRKIFPAADLFVTIIYYRNICSAENHPSGSMLSRRSGRGGARKRDEEGATCRRGFTTFRMTLF